MAAQGTLVLFEEFSLNIANGVHDMDDDTFNIALITDAVVAVAATASPDISTFTQVATGNGYTTGGLALTTTFLEAGGVATFSSTGGPSAWTQNGSGPTDIFQGIIYNTSAAATDAVGFIEMTTDNGVTPISLVDGDITITWNPIVFTLS